MGRGFAPKPADRRARVNKDPIPTTVLEFVPGEQPKLPAKMPAEGDKPAKAWPERTRAWWAMWGESPLSRMFTSSDWSELLDTAILHAKLWQGHTAVAPELRLRVAKFGATPEDRARLRITFAQADDADAKRPVTASPREVYGDLYALEAEQAG